jgi:hypothetical protein
MSTIINATTTNGVVIQPDNSGSLVLQTNSGTTALTIDTSQRAAFVAGTAALPAITTTGDTNTGMFFPAADTIAFAEGGTEVVRIDSSGNLCVGTTSASGGKLTVQVANGTTGLLVGNTSGTSAYNGALFYNNGLSSLVGQISVSGSTTSYNSISDYRLKENIVPMIGALDTVAQLKPVTYKWKIDGLNGQGFIAHELQAIVPDCVSGEKDAVDAEGNPKYQGIDTSFLVATLTAAIQELKAIVDAQAIRIETLEAK